MTFGHEKLDAYRVSLEYVRWSFLLVNEIEPKYRTIKDQLLRASQSIPLNIAEGNGKVSEPDRRRFFEVARGSALECAAAQDILEVLGAISSSDNKIGKQTLDRIVAMVTKLGGRGYQVGEGASGYGDNETEGGVLS